MIARIARYPCVCVQRNERKSAPAKTVEGKPQDGSVCMRTHTRKTRFAVLCCCFVGMHIASSSVVLPYTSTSSLLVDVLGWFR